MSPNLQEQLQHQLSETVGHATNPAGVAKLFLKHAGGDKFFRMFLGHWHRFKDGVWEDAEHDFNHEVVDMQETLCQKLNQDFFNGVKGPFNLAGEWVGRQNIRKLVQGCEDVFPVKKTTDVNLDNWILPLAGKGLDLKTGHHISGENMEKYYFTRRAACSPTAASPEDLAKFTEFVEEVLSGDDLDFLGRFCYYCLTGEIGHHTFLINVGTGANGKSVFWGAFSKMLGDFASTANPILLKKSKGGPNEHDASVVDISGSRLVFLEELGSGRLNENIVKDLVARPIHRIRGVSGKGHFTAKNCAKFVANTNSLPRFEGTDQAFLRRVAILEWKKSIPREYQDPELLSKFEAMPEAVLAWALSYRERFEQDKLNRPESLERAAEEYALRNSPHLMFVHECLEKCPTGSFISTSAPGFKSTLEPFLDAPIGREGWSHHVSLLTKAVKEKFKGIEVSRDKAATIFHGIRLKGKQ